MAIRLKSDDEDIDEVFVEDLITIGRGPGNRIQVENPQVSGIHGQIVRRDDQWWFEDLQSTNGSLVRHDGQEVVVDGKNRRETTIVDGATLILGDLQSPVVFEVRVVDDADLEAEEREQIARTIVASRAFTDLTDLSNAILDEGAERIRSLLELVERLQSQLEPSTVAAELAEFIFDSMPKAAVAGVFFEGATGIVPLLLRTRSSLEPLPIPWRRVEPLLKEAVERKAALQVDDAEAVPSRFEHATPGLSSALACPLLDGDTVKGLLVAASAASFEPRELDWLALLAHQASLTLRNASLVRELEQYKGRLEDENAFLKEKADQSGSGSVEIVGKSAALKKVLKQVDIVARTDTTVLVQGETGTGKELVARLLHERSPRADRLFAAVNCGALTETLLESELFGHVKGAFTGASKEKKGLFEVADGGTLFLDEFGDVSPRLQVKLLRVLENGEVTPVGSVKTRRVDVRIVSATNKDLKEEVSEGRFREDLYYRINVFPLNLPPLRDRQGDAMILAEHFLNVFSKKFDKRFAGFSDAAVERIANYAWPGNVRELQNEIERAALLAEDGANIEPEDLSERIGGHIELPVAIGPLHDTMARLESQYVRRALIEHDLNRTRTAKTLGISRQALTAKLHKYDLIDMK